MIMVLRLGHRPLRDKRITTHVALVARAFGASGMVMDIKDETVEKSVEKVTERWGGNFFIETKDWKKYIREWKGAVVHLTMYGIPIDNVIEEIKLKKDILVVVGAEKVSGEVFKLADYNLAVTNQPHSEVAALAIFLHTFFEGKELKKKFRGRLRIIPSPKSKKLLIKAEKENNRHIY